MFNSDPYHMLMRDENMKTSHNDMYTDPPDRGAYFFNNSSTNTVFSCFTHLSRTTDTKLIHWSWLVRLVQREKDWVKAFLRYKKLLSVVVDNHVTIRYFHVFVTHQHTCLSELNIYILICFYLIWCVKYFNVLFRIPYIRERQSFWLS